MAIQVPKKFFKKINIYKAPIKSGSSKVTGWLRRHGGRRVKGIAGHNNPSTQTQKPEDMITPLLSAYL